MSEVVLAIISGLIGIAGTVLAYKLNPKQKIFDELDALAKKEIKFKKDLDDALASNNSDMVTSVSADLKQLHERQGTLFQRLGKNPMR